jgi:hypothetical protein
MRPPRCWPRFGVRRDPLTGAFRPPAEATVRRVLARIDPDALDQAVGRWLARQPPRPLPRRPPPPRRPRRAVAVDGKTLRGSHDHAAPVHLLAAMDHTTAISRSCRGARSPSLTTPTTAATAASRPANSRSPPSPAWTSPTPSRPCGSPAASGPCAAGAGAP